MDNQLKKLFYRVLGIIAEGALLSLGALFFGEIINLTANISIQGIIGVLAIIGATSLLTILILTWNSKSSTIACHFIHLTVHQFKREKYITNNEKNTAYWVPDWLKNEIARNHISVHVHKGKMPNDYFKENNIQQIEKEPLPSQLGLIYKIDKTFSLIAPSIDSSLVNKLREFEFPHLQIAYIYPFQYNVLSTSGKDAPNKKLLLNTTTKQAYYPPSEEESLCGEHIINRQTYAFKKPLESLEGWCKRKKLTLNYRWLTEGELLKEGKKKPEVET